MALNTTFVAGTTVITAAHMNGLQSAWTSYGSGTSWTAVTANPAIGNGTWAGAFQQIGKNIDFRVVITMGSTTTYGTGQWRVALPVTPKSGVRWRFSDCEALDTGTNQYSCAGVWDSVSSTILIFRIGGGAAADSAVTSAAPFAWGSTDMLTISGRYEAA